MAKIDIIECRDMLPALSDIPDGMVGMLLTLSLIHISEPTRPY